MSEATKEIKSVVTVHFVVDGIGEVLRIKQQGDWTLARQRIGKMFRKAAETTVKTGRCTSFSVAVHRLDEWCDHEHENIA